MQGKLEKKSYKNWQYYSVDNGPDKPFIFMLHGYGADGSDLVSLSHYIDPEGKYSWVFPEAPLELSIPLASGRAWFPLDEEALQVAMMTGQARNFKKQKVLEMPGLIKSLGEFLNSFNLERGYILGGFSQGAMVSLHIHGLLGHKPLALLLLSTAVVDEEKLQLLSNSQIPTLVSHGLGDSIIPFDEGAYVSKLLIDHGYDSRFIEFRGGHEVNLDVLQAIGDLTFQVREGESNKRKQKADQS